MPHDDSEWVRNRRHFLKTALAGAASGVAARAGLRLPSLDSPAPHRGLPPDAALKELAAGNRRFVANQLSSINEDLNMLKQRTAEKQQPFAGVLSCADSRVPVELVFDQSIGQLFVARIAGNIVTPEIIGSLEYGVAVLGISAVLVLGHSHCGAVKAAMTTDAVPGQISSLYPHLRPAVEQSGGELAKAVALNATLQAELLRTSSTVIRKAVEGGAVKVASGVYDLNTGRVALT